jgi:hypothetical protein
MKILELMRFRSNDLGRGFFLIFFVYWTFVLFAFGQDESRLGWKRRSFEVGKGDKNEGKL